MPQPPLSDEQCREALDAVAAHGTVTFAAKALGIARGTLNNRLRAARARFAEEARLGHAPGHWNNGVAPGYLMGRVTVQRNAEGGVERTWERQSPDAELAKAAMLAAAEGMAADIPRAEPVKAPSDTLADLCNLYTFSDFHLGMLAWHKEGGADWDLSIAEATLAKSFRAMLDQSPPSRAAVVSIQGDWLHTDGLLPVTPASRHILDADGRFSEIVATAVRCIRLLVRLALERHESVHLIIAEGNHDEAGSVWLRHMFAALYEDEPRVTVNESELPFYVHAWGETLLGFHHGHKVKNEQLPLLFASQFRREWGGASHVYIHCGHRHHCDEKEYNGALVIQHPTIAARDAYAARGGWIAERAVQAITYHKRFGQVGRVYVTPEMLAA